jgi:polyisoprenoid-binding protein YceI
MTVTPTLPTLAAPTRWTLDPAGTSVEFSVKSFWGLVTVHGRFDRFDGFYEIGPDGARIQLTIDAESLDTGNRKRDEHLRSADFFHTTEHPQLTFTSTRVYDVGNGILHVVGELEAAGAVVHVEFPAFVRDVDGSLEVEATTTLDQARLGMSDGLLGMIRSPVTAHVRTRLNGEWRP